MRTEKPWKQCYHCKEWTPNAFVHSITHEVKCIPCAVAEISGITREELNTLMEKEA